MADLLVRPTELVLDSADSFWIENHHAEETLHLTYAKHPYDIGPGKKKIVPFEVVQLYFGDPRSKVGVAVPYKDSRGDGVVPERYSEVARLAVLYGVYAQGEENIAQHVELENHRLAMLNEDPTRIDIVRPLITRNFHSRITDLEGNEIIPPLFDREGKFSYGFAKDDQKSDDIAVLIAQMQRRIDQLETAADVVEEKGDNVDDGIAIDNPER